MELYPKTPVALTVILTKEDIRRQITAIKKYMADYNDNWWKHTRPIGGRFSKKVVLYSAEDRLRYFETLLDDVIKHHAHAVVYRLDKEYNLIRSIMI